MFSLFDIRTKLMVFGITGLLIVSAYYAGKFVESNACSAKAAVHQLTSEIKGKERQDAIAKDVRKLSDAERVIAVRNWMR